ncbi:hypothetical protein AKJ09_09376 [Labilithrix luteola]|uniref:RNA polymerase sigma-70 region 2 domain-containing protein n=1 Tax=Labilithrix luteola TaxID=1391654 RepID=A0A0K1QAG6_9BACT|nr:sigma-70 family RNA polymerase sigma factor [Labilithrix luteola]AKV02713.1 hypothetical protein AKJ09_09376 [Labilithrix luteola]
MASSSSSSSPSSSSSAERAAVGPELRAALVAMVRKRVPESDVEDIVQSALAEAFESPHAPKEPDALRRWIFGVAKNKVVDFHRRAGRETFELPDVPDAPAPHTEADLLRWAKRHLPEGDEARTTLDWMLREGDGEKLESIAASEKLPAPRVRQRVSRLRRHLKTHWAREVALLAALGVVITAIVIWVVRRPSEEPIAPNIHPEPSAEPMKMAGELRRSALATCDSATDDGGWKACLEGLDRAKALDPAGDNTPAVQTARRSAEEHLAPRRGPTKDDNITPPPVPTSKFDPLDSKSGPVFSKKATPAPSAIPTPTGMPKAAPKPTPTEPPPMPQKKSSIDSMTPPGLESVTGSGSGGGSGVGVGSKASSAKMAGSKSVAKPAPKKGGSKADYGGSSL